MKQQLVNQTKGTGFFLSAWQIMGFSSLMETLIYFKTTSNMLQEQILEIFCSPPPYPNSQSGKMHLVQDSTVN